MNQASITYPEALDHMLAAWNEQDSAKVRGHLEKSLADNVEFIDPSIVTNGIDQFEANVHEVLPGFDVTEVDEAGKVKRVLGFFGPLPSA